VNHRRVAALAIVIGCLAISCLVNKRSNEFECTMSEQCGADRSCEAGFCILLECPPGCDTCDTDEKQCTRTCDDANECGSFECPPDFDCTIRCTGANACESIKCEEGDGSCNITCDGPNACGSITCAEGVACSITCGLGECGSINCQDACRCDLTCTDAICPGSSCPNSEDGTECTSGGAADPCDSDFLDPSCNRC
jgi:hypothetical protein